MSDLVKLPADWHAETLANGQTIAPGEPFERSLLTDDDERVKGLLIGAHVTPVALEGDDLQERAKVLGIRGRSTMSADDLRTAVALAETHGVPTTPEEAKA